MKDTYYFPHDYNAGEDERCQFLTSKHGACGYGVYWLFIEKMHQQSDGKLTCELLDGLAPSFNVDVETLREIYNTALTVGLFSTDGEKYWSERVLRNKQTFNELREKRSRAGKLGMKARWGDNTVITNHNSVITNDNKPITNDNKVKESKEKEIIELFDKFWNEYPKKQAKQSAYRAFLKLKPDPELFDKLMKSLQTFKRSSDWTRDNGQYIPYPATWLNGKRWEDEIEKIPTRFGVV